MPTLSVTAGGASRAPAVPARPRGAPAARPRLAVTAALAATLLAPAQNALAQGGDAAAKPLLVQATPPSPAEPPDKPSPGPQPNQDASSTHQGPTSPRNPDARTGPSYRFAFHPRGDGYLRLDRVTGALSLCAPEGAAWSCVAARDERTVLDREIARLQRDNAALKSALLERGGDLPAGMAPPLPRAADGANQEAGGPAPDEGIPRPPQTVPPTPGTMPAPGERRIMDAVERSWRRLVDVMSDLRRELQH